MSDYKDLDAKLNELIEEVNAFSDKLPNDDLYDLGKKLRTSLKLASPSLRSYYQKRRKLDKIRSMIETNSYFEECKNYLNLSSRLRYGDTSELVEKVDELSSLLYKGTHN